ncbi:hypothetical protein DIT71_04185 [Marinobacter vulgaris]|uniref:Uncharacterized protein n=1 Tax=Marinobacter vulgaris TaxID=1928331 RepID=A0A2V4A1H9_9GAMM|nr:hypothetical protein [Marinobacter vulgaris]PXX92404.1 hypothetical protein DIT71_04185 [Marinobacter vulgaris]TSJ71653.1 hypothetical protein FPC41_05285 [Marinobacter vulgaris]
MDIAQASIQFDAALADFARARSVSPQASSLSLLERARILMTLPGGFDVLYRRVPALESAGIFGTSDWSRPGLLQPALAKHSLREASAVTTVVEAISEIRLLAVVRGDYFHRGISSEQARHFLTQVMALNLDLLSGTLTEADRERPKQLGIIVEGLYQYLISHLGYESLLDSLVAEVWRLLEQGPVQVDSICDMIGQIAKCLYDPELETTGAADATRLVRALFAPTPGSKEDPGLDIYQLRLTQMDELALSDEARKFARNMHDTGLASPYHAVFLRFLRTSNDEELIPTALGLTMTGLDDFYCYNQLVHTLIDEAIYPQTCQAVFGLTMMLERGSLFTPATAQALWRQIKLKLSTETEQALIEAFGNAVPPRVFLLAGVLNLLGQPLGVGQGNNPSCQSAIGLSMWAANEADYLLQVLAWAARDNEVLGRFEGWEVSSKNLEPGLVKDTPVDVDPVSLILIPHLDRIYAEMWRRCEDRDDDAHRWINPEFYGWWVSHGFRVVADIHTGEIKDYDSFIRHFYASYHPYYNGNLPVIHHQPAGIAVTDSAARFVGRHAITIQRVALSPDNEMRVYFFNPNNDSGQDWGQGITCSTRGNGEIRGEASLPVAEFASRLYAFHYDTLELGDLTAIPEAEVAKVMELGYGSWAATEEEKLHG